MRTTRTTTWRWAVTTLAAASVLAGCGGGDDDASDEADSEADVSVSADQAEETIEAATDDVPADVTANSTTADDAEADDAEADDTEAGNDTAPEAAAGEVPDPCTLVSADELSAILGSDPGEGTVNAVTPDERKICTYSSGLILAVEVAENYDTSVELMQDVAPVQDVPGVGEAAGWQDFGGDVGQFVALDDEYFVGVTLPAGGKAAGQAIAEAMLGAL